MSSHDLRRKAQRLSDLRIRYEAQEPLSSEELAELRKGISHEEMNEIIQAIRGERRNAQPSKKARATNEKRELAEKQSKPIDIHFFRNNE